MQLFKLSPEDRQRKKREIDEQINLVCGPENILCSYPRSGSIWLRSLLYDYNALLSGKKIKVKKPRDLPTFSPQIEVPKFKRNYGSKRYPNKVLKTHLRFQRIRHIAGDKKIAVLYRRPADCLVSAFRKRVSRAYKRNRIGRISRDSRQLAADMQNLGIDEYCRSIMNGWASHARSYLDAWNEHEFDIHFVSYENLREDTPKHLLALASFFGFENQPEYAELAAENRKFEAVKQSARKQRDKINIDRGLVGAAETELSARTREEIEALCMPLYGKLRLLETSNTREK